MAKRDPSNRRNSGKSPDPYLRTFLRQAVAIIAAERGLNESSQAKLQALAVQLGLSDSAYHSALEKLKLPTPSLGLNQYEKRFVEFLSGEFKKMSGDILTIKAENNVIDLAERKYQISEIRAQQLIRKTAEDFGVGTISHHDAELFATSLIDDTVDDRTWLRDHDKQRLSNACQKWGMAQDEIDDAIQVRLAKNRRQRKNSILVMLSTIAGAVFFLAALIYGFQQLDWKSLLANREIQPTTKPVAESTASNVEFPSFFDVRLTEKFNNAMATDKKLATFEKGQRWQKDERRETCLQLVDLALTYVRPNESLNEFISSLYYAETDAGNSAVILEAIQAASEIFDRGQLISTQRLRRAFTASHLIGSMIDGMKDGLTESHRSQLLIQYVGESVGITDVSLLGDRYLQFNDQMLLEKSWRHVLKHVGNDGRRVIALLTELEKKSSGNSSAVVNEIRTILVFEMIGTLGSGWDQIRPSIQASILQSDITTANLWIDELTQLEDWRLSQFVAEALAQRLELAPNQPRDSLLRELAKIRSTNRFRGYSEQIESSSIVEDTIRIVENELGEIALLDAEILQQLPATKNSINRYEVHGIEQYCASLGTFGRRFFAV